MSYGTLENFPETQAQAISQIEAEQCISEQIRFPEDLLRGILLVNQRNFEPIPVWMTINSGLFREE